MRLQFGRVNPYEVEPVKKTVITTSTETETSDSDSFTSEVVVPSLKRQNAFHFDVRAILRGHPSGREVEKSIDKKGFCNPSDRRVLVNSCISYLMEIHGPKPDSIVKEALAGAVITAFPSLKDPHGKGYEAFYTKGSHKRPAFGWLEDHLRYVRKKNKSTAAMVSPKVEHEDKKAEHESGNGSVEHEDMELQQKTQWLKDNKEPQKTIQEYMMHTALQRAAYIKHGEKSIQQILEEYPRILDPQMIEQDFEILLPHAACKLTEKWEKMTEQILFFADKMCSTWKNVFPDIDMRTLTQEEKQNLSFCLLPVIFKGRGGRKATCTLLDSVKAFIDFMPDVTHVEDYCNKISEVDRPQPFILTLGSERFSPQQVFVIIERKPLLQNSVSKSVDLCFKSHYVFDVHYQVKAKGAWEFLQSEVYELGRIQSGTLSSFRAFSATYCKT